MMPDLNRLITPLTRLQMFGHGILPVRVQTPDGTVLAVLGAALSPEGTVLILTAPEE